MSKKPFSDKRWTEPLAVTRTGEKVHFTEEEKKQNRQEFIKILKKHYGIDITEEELIKQGN